MIITIEKKSHYIMTLNISQFQFNFVFMTCLNEIGKLISISGILGVFDNGNGNRWMLSRKFLCQTSVIIRNDLALER